MAGELQISHRDQGTVAHRLQELEPVQADVELEGFPHYMLKEIFEQPRALANALRGRLCEGKCDRRVWRPEPYTAGTARREPHYSYGLRHKLARGAGGGISYRGAGPTAGGSRVRERVAVPQSASGRGNAAVRDYAERRDGRHARGPARDETQGAPDACHLQRGREQHCPGSGRREFICTPGRKSESPRPRRTPRSALVLALLALYFGACGT